MKSKRKQRWILLNEAITDFIEIKSSHYNQRIPNFTLLPTKKFVNFNGAKITVKLVSHYNMNRDYIPIVTHGQANCNQENIYTKGYGIDLAFRKASEAMERKCKKLLIAYSKDHMLKECKVFEECPKPFYFKDFKMGVPKGHRNNELHRLAKVHKHEGYPILLTKMLLKAFNKDFCKPPVSEDELQAIINDIYIYNIYNPSYEKLEWDSKEFRLRLKKKK